LKIIKREIKDGRMSAQLTVGFGIILFFLVALNVMATGGVLFILLREIPNFRKEKGNPRLDGLIFASDQLLDKEFQSWRAVIYDAYKAGGINYPTGVERHVVSALSRLDFVAKLIQIGIVDKNALLYLFADDLNLLHTAIKNFENREKSQIPRIKTSFPNGFILLEEASYERALIKPSRPSDKPPIAA
jgi:hypothetical protein